MSVTDNAPIAPITHDPRTLSSVTAALSAYAADDGPAPREWADTSQLTAEAVQFTQDLVRIKSVNNGEPDIGDGEDRAIDYIAERLAEVGLTGDYAASRPGRGNYRIVIPGDDPEALLLHGHVDVVPANASDWTHDPFSGDIIDGWIWGRGTVDMKSFVGMMVAVARHCVLSGVRPRRTLVMVWFSDEEHDGRWGSRWLVKHHPEWFIDAVIALSEVGGFSITLPDHGVRTYPLAVGEKGVAWAELTATGRAGHGSRPLQDNSVATIAQAVSAIGQYTFPVQHTPGLDATIAEITAITGQQVTDDNIEQIAETWGFWAPIVQAGLRNTAVPTQVHAGYAVNVVPSQATATMDCRVLPGYEQEFFDTIDQLLVDAVGEDYRDRLTIDFAKPHAVSVDPAHPFVSAVRAALTSEDADGVVVPYLLPAGTDNKILQTLGLQCFGFNPLRLPADFDAFAHFHAVDERVPVEAVEFGARVLAQLVITA